MVLAAFLSTALVVGGVGAWHLLRGNRSAPVREMFSMAMRMLIAVTPLQILAGDQQGLNTLEHQPVKIMAMEGHDDSHPNGAPLILFGIPNAAEKRIDYAIEIPKISSLILEHDLNAPMAGLDTIPDEDEPPVMIVFFSFRMMIGLGFAMLGLGVWAYLEPVPRHAVYRPLDALGHDCNVTDGLCRRPCRLDHHRGRAPAVYCLGIAAHRRQPCPRGRRNRGR